MKTKQEVISFLESKVGTTVPCKGTPSLDGQCVTLIKSLMEFLGVPDPYKARGHAKTAISAYLSEGIASSGAGFLSVFSNKNMGGGYGHIWLNAGEGDGVFYESNGAKPLIVTKGKTYSYDTVCNFDKYIKGEPMANELETCMADRLSFWKQRDEALNKLVEADKRIKELEAQIANHKCPTLPVDTGSWKENGKSITTVVGNVSTTVNYALKA